MAGQLVVGNMLNLEEYEDDIKGGRSSHSSSHFAARW